MKESDNFYTPNKSQWRTPTALVFTTSWLLLALWWTFFRPSSAWAIPNMDPNAWGDWAGGTFAPLAFLWLVIGYFQQGEELRDNVKALHLQEKALHLQVQELRESVEQQTAAAVAAGRQADMLEKSQTIALRAQVLEHQPRFSNFRVVSSDRETRALTISVENFGRACHEAGIRLTQPHEDVAEGFDSWGSRDEHSTTFELSAWTHSSIVFEISYTDELLIEQAQRFRTRVSPWPQSGAALHVSLENITFNLPPGDEWTELPDEQEPKMVFTR
jgi:hypothetical protein